MGKPLGVLVFILPISVTVVVMVAMVSAGVGFDRSLGVSGFVFAVLQLGATQLDAHLERRITKVLVISASRSAQANLRVKGVVDAIGSNRKIKVITTRPRISEWKAANWRSSRGAWAKHALFRGLSEGADYLVINHVDEAIKDVIDELIEVGRAGKNVIILGDPDIQANAGTDGLCLIRPDPAVGGFLAGQELANQLDRFERAKGVLIIRSFPTYERPRAANAILALKLAEKIDRVTVLMVDDSSELRALGGEILSIAESSDDTIVACTTDSQLMALTRMLKNAHVGSCDHLLFIGYDGTLDDNGDLLVEASPLRVIGTVDTQPYELGRLAGEEILRRAEIGKRNAEQVVHPAFRACNDRESM